MDLEKEVMWYGSARPSPKQHQLKAGSCTLMYESGALRMIRVGQHEVLRMIYLSLRDEQWGTIIPAIINEQIHEEQQGFSINYKAHFKHAAIDLLADVSISGNQDGEISFEFSGEAKKDFRTNRTGICVLHPAKECTGKEVTVHHSNDTSSTLTYPSMISPHQPAKDIIAMSWSGANQRKAQLQFEGEIFEMEDQRNWTDNSFKTYCRPLALPFPYTIKKGEKVHQRVTLRLSDLANHQQEGSNLYQLTYNEDMTFDLPKIGIRKKSSGRSLDEKASELLSAVNFDFYAVDVVFSENWKQDLRLSVEEAISLDLKVKLQVQFSSKYSGEVMELSEVLKDYKDLIDAILILDSDSTVADDAFVSGIAAQLKPVCSQSKIGTGTLGNFVELNTKRPGGSAIDFISYSINPQVHAFDNTTLVENLNGQSATVLTAKSLAKGKEIHLSPVTLQPTAPPSARADVNDEKTTSADPRQISLFGGAWVLGSIKKLAESGASSVCYFETIGENGIIQGDSPLSNHHLLPADTGAVYPMYYIFLEILTNKEARILQSLSSHPMEYEGMVLEFNGKKTIILVNFTNRAIQVGVHGIAPNSKVKKLDEKSYMEAVFNSDKYINAPFCDFKFEGEINLIKMRPYALVIINE